MPKTHRIYEDTCITPHCIDLLPVWQMSHSCAMNRCDLAVIRRIVFRLLNALELNVEGTLICWERSSSYCSDVTVDPCQCFAYPVRLSHARASFTVRSQRARGETLRSRAAHRLHSLARNQSRVYVHGQETVLVTGNMILKVKVAFYNILRALWNVKNMQFVCFLDCVCACIAV